MNILIDIGHPGHVHLLRQTAKQLEMHGHTVFYSVRDIPVAKHLMAKYGMDYLDLGKKYDGLLGKAWTVIKQDIILWWFVITHHIDIGLSSGIALPHVSKFSPMKSIVFDDDDDDVEDLVVKYCHPFADTVLTPSCTRNHRKTTKAIFYEGYHELAYLHPSVFKPDAGVLSRMGIVPNQDYFVLRFVALKGHHDVGQKGLSKEQKVLLIKLLEKHGRVIITSERELDPEFEPYRLAVPAEDMHSVMYYAKIFVGDSQTMASEAAILGVPSLRCNTFVGKISYLEEEQHKYDLTYGFQPDCFNQLIEKIQLLLDTENLHDVWATKRNHLLQDKINVSLFFTWFIESYPQSVKIMQNNPDYQWRFK